MGILLQEKRIAVVDIETTGPNYDQGDEIIQIGAVIYKDSLLETEFSMLINPQRPIPEKIVQLTGIHQEQVEDAPSFESVVGLWYHRLKDCLFVAHNLNFDYQFLKYNFEKFGYEFTPQAVDTVILSKILFYDSVGFNLTDLSHYSQLSYSQAHDALADARLTGQLLGLLAHKISKLPEHLRQEVKEYVEALPYQTELIFDYFETFMFVNSNEPSKRGHLSQDFKNTQLDYDKELSQIIEQSKEDKHLLIENPQIPLNREFINQLVDRLLQEGHRLLFSVRDSLIDQTWLKDIDTSRFTTTCIFPPSYFIHQAAFKEILKTNLVRQFNQQELVVIGATLVWLNETDRGVYSEINQELNSLHFIQKFGSGKLKLHSHYYFNRMKDQLMNSQLIFIDHWYLNVLLDRNESNLLNSLDESTYLVIDNLKAFIGSQRRLLTKELSLSKCFDVVRQIFEDFSYHKNHLTQRLELHQFLHETHILMEWIEEVMKNTCFQDDSKQGELSLFLDKSSHYWQDFLKRMLSWLQSFKHIQHIKDYVPQEAIKHTLEKQIASVNSILLEDENHYYELFVEHFNNNFFNFRIRQSVLSLKEKQRNLIYRFNRSIIFSPGGYFSDLVSTVEPVYSLAHHQYLSLILDNQKLITSGLVPLLYCSYQDDPRIQVELIHDYILDHRKSLHGKIIILTHNKDFCDKLYRYFETDRGTTLNYSIYSQTMMGSSHKIYRRFSEAEKGILIFTYSEIKKVTKEYNLGPVTLMLTRLPFISLNHSYIQTLKYTHFNNREDLFNLILFPRMVQDFKELLTYIREFYIFNKVIIFDERVFTKSYSNKLQEHLKSIIEFESV